MCFVMFVGLLFYLVVHFVLLYGHVLSAFFPSLHMTRRLNVVPTTGVSLYCHVEHYVQ